MMKKTLLTTALVVGGLFSIQAQQSINGYATKAPRSLQKGGAAVVMPATDPSPVPAQRKCGTVDLLREQQAQGIMPSDAEFEQWLSQKTAEMNAARSQGGGNGPLAPQAVVRIPYIVHVIHSGQAIGSGANISAAQVQSQIDVLNEDFRKKFGTPGYNTHPAGADMEIEFIPAQVDLNGNVLAEPGIHRHQTSTASYTTSSFQTVKTQTSWNPNKYANFWTTNLSGGILGYAQFPTGSTLPGMPGSGATNTDGVVVGFQYFGSIAKVTTSQLQQGAPFNRGRTLTHEVGHWLGLRHIWGDGDCTVDDFCNDTPLAGAANYGCPTGTNSCSAPPVDMIENYMDYTDDACMNIFTNDQKGRMVTVLANSPGRKDLLTSTVGALPVVCAATGAVLPLNETFEAAGMPANWYIKNADNDSTWRKRNVSAFGTGNSAVGINNFTSDFRGKTDIIATPQHDFTAITGAVLAFDVAYSAYSQANSDTLMLVYSTDCGNTFVPFWKKGGSQLSTTNGAFTTLAFVPTATQWRTETVNLGSIGSQIFGTGKNRIVIGFMNKSGYGNYMYLDNIRITSGAPVAAAPTANFTSNSDGNCAGKNITFTDKSTGAVSRAWTFQGGTPATSTAINPTVTYPNAGTFAVRLIATNTAGSDTLVDSSYVTIEPAATQRLPLFTNFEPTDADSVKWQVYNPDADSTWKPVAIGSGVSANSMAIDNFSDNFYGKIDGLMSNKLRFTNAGNQKLSFNVAYGFYGTDSTVTPPVTLADSLFVLASTDCGASFRKVWAKGGKDLATVAGLVKTKFVPNGVAQWRRENISLTPFSSEGSVILALVNKSGYGNVVYVDSIAISTQSNCPQAPQLPTSLPAICEGGTINLSTTNLAGATYSWTGPNGFTSAVRNPAITAATANNAGTYSVTITVGGCTSPASSVAVTVNTAPSAPIASVSASSLCSNDTLRLMATTVPEAAYSWTGPNSFVSNEQNPKLVGLTSAMAGVYSVRAISRGCTSAVGSVTVNNISTAPSNITLQSGTTNICAGANIAMSATAVTNAVYTWTGPNGFTSTVRNPTITGATTAAAGTYTVVASLGACSSNVASVTINVRPAPNKPTISISASNDTLICDTIAPAYQWYANTTAITGATQRRFKPLVNGNYSVRIGNGQNCFNTSIPYAFVISSVGSDFLNQAVSVYPNPSKGVFKLNIEHEGSASEVKVTVFDVLGKAVYSSSDKKSDVLYQQEIDLQNMPNGMYFVQIQEGDMMVTKRVLKSNQ